MYYTVCDIRKLAVAAVQPGTGKFFNWATTGWEAPFAPANHLKPLAAILTGTPVVPVLAPFQTVDVGTVLLQSDVAMLAFTVDGAGAPIEGVDVGTLPFPVPYPVMGGFSR